jgi:hypothetical protein
MPSAATSAAPLSAPAIFAESALVRSIDSAPISRLGGMVAPISALRIPMSDGRTSPASAVTANTAAGLSVPVSASVVRIDASTA